MTASDTSRETSPGLQTVRGVLLDVDGTLLDSNVGHAQAWVDALAESDIQVDLARVQPLIGKGGDKVLPELAHVEADSERGKTIKDRRAAIFKERYLPACRPFPRARDLVERLRRDGLKLVVATSASSDELADLLDAAGVRDLIEDAANDAERSKPDPDIVAAAIRRSRLPPEDLVMLGDTPYDIEAATRAGVSTIALRSGGWRDADLAGAIAAYDDVEALLARYDASRSCDRVIDAPSRPFDSLSTARAPTGRTTAAQRPREPQPLDPEHGGHHLDRPVVVARARSAS